MKSGSGGDRQNSCDFLKCCSVSSLSPSIVPRQNSYTWGLSYQKREQGKQKKGKNRMKQADCSAEARTQLPDISSRFRLRQWERLRPYGEGTVTQTCHRTWSLDSEATAAAVICVCRRAVPRSDTSTLSCHPIELGGSQQSYSLTLACRTTCKKLFASCRCLRRMLQT